MNVNEHDSEMPDRSKAGHPAEEKTRSADEPLRTEKNTREEMNMDKNMNTNGNVNEDMKTSGNMNVTMDTNRNMHETVDTSRDTAGYAGPGEDAGLDAAAGRRRSETLEEELFRKLQELPRSFRGGRPGHGFRRGEGRGPEADPKAGSRGSSETVAGAASGTAAGAPECTYCHDGECRYRSSDNLCLKGRGRAAGEHGPAEGRPGCRGGHAPMEERMDGRERHRMPDGDCRSRGESCRGEHGRGEGRGRMEDRPEHCGGHGPAESRPGCRGHHEARNSEAGSRSHHDSGEGFPRAPLSRERILMILARSEGGLRQGELGRQMRVNPSSMSEFITKLEEDGYVQKSTDPADKRATLITLTEAGAARAEELEQERGARFSGMFAALTEEEKAELLRLLNKLGTGRE